MDGAAAEGSRSTAVALAGLLCGSKPTTHEPGQGHELGHRHAEPTWSQERAGSMGPT